MAKKIIKKKIVPKHILVVDTNELWQEIKNDVISEDFETFWLEYAEKFSLELNKKLKGTEGLKNDQSNKVVKK